MATLSYCIIFDWQDFFNAKFLRLIFKLTYSSWAHSLSPTFRGGIIFPFKLIISISWAGLTVKTLYRKKQYQWKWHRSELLIYFIFSLCRYMYENSQSWIISNKSVLLHKRAPNNMAFILPGSTSRHYAQMVLQTFTNFYRKSWTCIPTRSNDSSWGPRYGHQ